MRGLLLWALSAWALSSSTPGLSATQALSPARTVAHWEASALIAQTHSPAFHPSSSAIGLHLLQPATTWQGVSLRLRGGGTHDAKKKRNKKLNAIQAAREAREAQAQRQAVKKKIEKQQRRWEAKKLRKSTLGEPMWDGRPLTASQKQDLELIVSDKINPLPAIHANLSGAALANKANFLASMRSLLGDGSKALTDEELLGGFHGSFAEVGHFNLTEIEEDAMDDFEQQAADMQKERSRAKQFLIPGTTANVAKAVQNEDDSGHSEDLADEEEDEEAEVIKKKLDEQIAALGGLDQYRRRSVAPPVESELNALAPPQEGEVYSEDEEGASDHEQWAEPTRLTRSQKRKVNKADDVQFYDNMKVEQFI